jgi:hypothetical protein
VPPFSHLASCTPTKCNLYFPNSLATGFNEPILLRTLHPKCQIIYFLVPGSCQRVHPGTSLPFMICNKLEVSRWGVVSPPPNHQAGGPPPVGCPRLFIQYIRSYPPYLEAVSSIRNLRTRHAVVTGDPLNMLLRLPQ